jgi:diguanylate cyclase (GGDEF)-like protein/PAS domain S-box-containing protein
MNPLLKYQLHTIGFDGKLDELQAVALLDAVNKSYDKADEDRMFWEKMLNASSKGTRQLYKDYKDDSLNKLLLTEKKYQKLLMNLQPYYFFYTKNHEGRLEAVSESVVGMLGFSAEEFIRRYGKLFMYGLRSDLETRLLISEYGYNMPYEMTVRDKKGEERIIEITEFPIFNELNELMEVEGIVRDVTEHYKVNHKISNMLYYDALTGISNRLHLEVLMEKLLLDNYRKQKHFAVLFLDLDHFKHINDTLGHDVGDSLLQQIAESIKKSLRSSDIFARIGGDEFVIVLKDIEDVDLTVKLHDLLDLIRQPWIVKEYELSVSVSIGVALYPEDGRTIVDLMKNADIAMYKSKSIGRDNFTFFEEHFNTYVHTEMNLLQDMSEAIENEEFLFHYQPKVLLSTNEMVAAEALIRWEHPKMGLIYPDKFIDLAENTGLILKLGRWVVKEACRSIAWFNEVHPNKKLKLSINISIRQFQHEDMYDILKNAIEKYGIDASQLSIEITESIMMENNKEMAYKLNKIKSLNVGISLDDFGTGYSTLSYLDKLSIDELKIDKAFIDAIPEDGDKNILLDTIIAMGKTLNMTVVAEGVEYEYQRKYLEKKQCDIYQGYLFAKPVTRQECLLLLTNIKKKSESFSPFPLGA